MIETPLFEMDELTAITTTLQTIEQTIQNAGTALERRRLIRERTVFYVNTLLGKYRMYTVLDTQEIYLYNPDRGIYEADGESTLEKALQTITAGMSNKDMTEIIKKVRIATYCQRSVFEQSNKRRKLLAVKNGVIDLNSFEFEEHSWQNFLLSTIPVEYDPNATCPAIEEFLAQIVWKEDVELLLAMIGYCLYPGYPFHKAFILLGSGRNGKSTLIALIRALLGEDNVSEVNLQEFSSDRYAAAALYGKMANLASDLPVRTVSDLGYFKALTSGVDRIRAQLKYKNGFKFKNRAKMIFSCNQAPRLSEDDSAIWSRLVLINFPNKFKGKDADTDLINKLCKREELQGLLVKALVALQKLLADGGFKSSEVDEENTRETYLRSADPLRLFGETVLEYSPGAVVPKQDLYQIYLTWHSKFVTNSKTCSRAKMSRTLPEIVPYAESDVMRVGGKLFRVWTDISIKEKYNYLLR